MENADIFAAQFATNALNTTAGYIPSVFISSSPEMINPRTLNPDWMPEEIGETWVGLGF